MHRSLASEGERDFPSSSFRFEIPQHSSRGGRSTILGFIEASTARRDLNLATKEKFRKGGITFHRDDALSQDSGLTNLARKKKKKKITTKWQLKSIPKIPISSISFVPASWMRRKEEEEDPATTKSILLPLIDLK